MEGLDIEFRKLSVYDVGALGERFDLVFFIGVLLSPATSAARARPHPRTCRARPAGVPVDAARQRPTSLPVARGLRILESETRSTIPAIPKLHFIEHRYAHDPTNWWAPNRAASEAMLRSAGFAILSHPEDEVFICRAERARPGAPNTARCIPHGRTSAADDRSGDDLERAQQQVALGSRERSRLATCSPTWRGLPAQAIAAERPGLPRVLGGMSPIDPDFIRLMSAQGVLERRRRGRGARLPARLEPLA